MKLSLVFELLLIFVLLAFAASEAKSVGKQNNNGINTNSNNKVRENRNDTIKDNNDDKPEESTINRYCRCSQAHCNCCRDFSVPYVNLDGPGCASLMYLESGKMSVSLSFGRKVITNKTLRSNKPSPVCMPLPGGITKFCGRVYNIARTGEEFRACLGLELQNKKTVEAAVRVSCFKFGPRGVHSEPADPLPLVPQDEKTDDEDDDDDDDDDYGLDDDDDTELGGINDVGDTADYTGFSILGEDLLGDLFGGTSTGNKKPNKPNKHRKKQAPAPSTTTTKRPRTTRPKPPRRPTSRIPTSTTARTTTVRVRPVNRRTRRPTRRPGRPNRRPTTAETSSSSAENTISTSLLTSPGTTPVTPSPTPAAIPAVPAAIIPAAVAPSSTERIQFLSTAQDNTYEPIILVTQRPSASSVSTPKTATSFADPGLEMSLAQLTGQLAAMPSSPIIQDGAKDTGMLTTSHDLVTFEKVQTITPKGTTAVFSPSSVKDDMVQIVHSLDSSEEKPSEKEKMVTDESRSRHIAVPAGHYEGLSLPKKKNRQFAMEDLDVLDLSEIGETVGEQIGLFNRNKRQNKEQNTNNKVKPNQQDNDDDDEESDYDVLGLEAIGDTVGEELGIFERDKRHNEQNSANEQQDDDYEVIEDFAESLAVDRAGHKKGKANGKGRSRQNKMMRGDWSRPQV